MGQWARLHVEIGRRDAGAGLVVHISRSQFRPSLWLFVFVTHRESFSVSNQSADLPNSRLIANSTRKARSESYLLRGLAGIFSLALVSIKLQLETSLGILDR